MSKSLSPASSINRAGRARENLRAVGNTVDSFCEEVAHLVGATKKAVQVTLALIAGSIIAGGTYKAVQPPYPNYKAGALKNVETATSYKPVETVLADNKLDNQSLTCLRERFYTLMTNNKDSETMAGCGDQYYTYKTPEEIADARKAIFETNGLPPDLELWIALPTVNGTVVKFYINPDAYKKLTPEQRAKVENTGLMDMAVGR